MAHPSPQHPQVGLWIEHRRIAGWVLVFGPGLLGLVWMAAGLLISGVAVLQLAAGPPLLTALVIVGLRRRLGQRVRAAQAGQEPPVPRRRLAFGLGVLGLLGAAALVAWGRRVPSLVAPGSPGHEWLTRPLIGALSLGGALLLALCARFYATTDRGLLPEARGLATWLRAGAWSAGLAGLALIAPAVHAPSYPVLHSLAHRVGEVLVAIAVLELCARGVVRRPARIDPAADLFLLGLVASRWNPVSSLFGTLTDAFGIDLRGTWSLRFIQRSLAPLALGLVLLAWLASAFTLVDTSEVGVVETFGAPVAGAPRGAGLVLHWPWPVQRVRRVPTGRVRSIPIGFVGGQQGASLLWTRRHAEQEHALLIGDGEDLVTVNATLQYRVADARAWLYSVADADAELAVIADRALMRETIGRTLEGVLSENLVALTARVEGDVQAEADRLGLGLEVVDFTLLGLHPPMAVARDYQGVVGAQIEQDTLVFEAEADRARALPAAAAAARTTRAQANAAAVRRTALASGEAQGFRAQVEASRAAPDLFRFRRLLEAREKQLAGQSFVVIDERFERQGAVLRVQGRPEEGDR